MNCGWKIKIVPSSEAKTQTIITIYFLNPEIKSVYLLEDESGVECF